MSTISLHWLPFGAAMLSAFFSLEGIAFAQSPLSSISVPLPANLNTYVKDRASAIRLGKALFWDQQAGGDGQIACASCHFQAGADVRATNSLNPGKNGVFNSLTGAGGTLTPANFPIRTDDICGSQGIVSCNFIALDPTDPLARDLNTPVNDGTFFPNRQVTGRNAPSTIMAAFMVDNFWDGRAKEIFNGVSPGGKNAAPATILFNNLLGLAPKQVAISPASTASQAVGPANNPVEMSTKGRKFAQLGRKLIGRTPLALQVIASNDSVLSSVSQWPATGLSTTYAAMIRAAFQNNLHNSATLTRDGFTQMESNFSLFWGLAILLYEATLVPNQSPFDRWAAGNATAMTASQIAGFDVFQGRGRCDKCHGGTTFSGATLVGGEGDPFANIGSSLTSQDPGRMPDALGEFMVPTLRNTELTGPYFHNGHYMTLRQVVDFYNRGGDFNNAEKHSQVRSLELTETEKVNLVAFLTALTDDRVRYERAPFDHPSLFLANSNPLPCVGATGLPVPVSTFLNADPQAR